MLKILFLKVLILFSFTLVFCGTKDTLEVVLYNTSMELYHDKPMDVDALVITKNLSDNYFFANKIIDKKTGKKVKESKFIWAIKYNNEVYVNMGYIIDIDVPSPSGMYIKLDIVGDYGVLVFDLRMPYKSSKGNRTSTSLGLEGYIVSKLNEKFDQKYLWYVNKNESVPILYCNLLEKEYRNFQLSRNESCIIQFISKKQLKKIEEKYPEIAIQEEPHAKDVLKYFELLNLHLKNK